MGTYKDTNIQFLYEFKPTNDYFIKKDEPKLYKIYELLKLFDGIMYHTVKAQQHFIENFKLYKEENENELKNIIETIEKQYKDPDLTLKKINENEHKLNEIINKLPQDLKSKVTEMKEELIKNNISPLIENNISIDKVEILEESK